MTSSSDRLEATKDEIRKKLEELAGRLDKMKKLHEIQTSTITDLENTFNSTDAGQVLIKAKEEAIKSANAELVDQQQDLTDATLVSRGQKTAIQMAKKDILSLETQIQTDQKLLDAHKVTLNVLQTEKLALEKKIQEARHVDK